MNIKRIIVYTLAVLFAVELYFSVSSYFTGLSQYATADQDQFTMPRVLSSTDNFTEASFSDGSNLSRLLVGVPGKMLDTSFKAKHQYGDEIFSGIHYTPVLPFAIFQVIFTLIVLFVCSFFIGRLLKINFRDGLYIYFLIALVLLNIPIFKGDIKVLKYDALSISCSITAIVLYLLYKSNSKKKFLVLSLIFHSLAFLEKDLALLPLIFMGVIETISIMFQQAKNEKIYKDLAKFYGLTLGILTGMVFIFIPKFWTSPGEITLLFSRIVSFISIMSVTQFFVALFMLIIIFFLIRLYYSNKISFEKWLQSKINTRKIIMVIAAVFILAFIVAITYQKNNMWFANNYADKPFAEKITKEGYYVTTEFAETALTTLDKSPLLSKTKFSFNIVRLFTYVMPEIVAILVFLIPLLVYIYYGKFSFSDKKLLMFSSVFPLMYFIFYFAMVPPIESKYMLNLYLLSIITGLLVLITIFNKVDNIYISGAVSLLIAAALVVPMNAASPSHLGYMSSFRDKSYENTEFHDMNVYSNWTWQGWGETSYPIFNYLEKNTTGEVQVLFDYSTPFHFNKRIKPLYSSLCRQRHMQFEDPQMLDMMTQLHNGKVDYIQISKNMAFRSSINNFIVKNYKHKAVFKDLVCGIEYGWLFKTKDLLDAVSEKKK